jgi:hypothetical protein
MSEKKEVPQERRNRKKRESEEYSALLEHIEDSLPAVKKLATRQRQSEHFAETDASKKRRQK